MKSWFWRLVAGFITLVVLVAGVFLLVKLWGIGTSAFVNFMARFPLLQTIGDWAAPLLILLLVSWVIGELFFKERI